MEVKHVYEVFVEGVGVVHVGCDEKKAVKVYHRRLDDSMAGRGRYGRRAVKLFQDGMLEYKYDPDQPV